MFDRTVSNGATIFYRMFGWMVLGTLAAFLINNILIVAFGYNEVQIADGITIGNALQLSIYASGLLGGMAIVYASSSLNLRQDSVRIHCFNLFIIRTAFWIVCLTGIADSLLAFMRVENLLIYFVSKETAASLGYSNFVAPILHLPIMIIGLALGMWTRTLGFLWLSLLIVAAELLIVISRFVFSYEQALMGDLVRYWYAALFLFSSAYTLYDEGHVRVDVLYAGFSRRARGRTNSIGSIFFGGATCVVILLIGMGSKQSIINSPIAIFEVSQAGNIGMFIKYQMAAFLAIFASTMLIQFVSYFLESVADVRDEPGARQTNAVVQ
jgi:TRAP-type mannitol/chloroaromatic compound transport system permease small subunit